jgi:hypothetical protein
MSTVKQLLSLTSDYADHCQWIATAKIKKLPNGQYRVLSEKGKNLGTSDTKEKAEKRLRQIEFFKHQDQHHAESIIDLSQATDFSFSAIMRELRQHGSAEQVNYFLKLFHQEFNQAYLKELQQPEKVALQNSLTKFNKKHKIKVKGKLVKAAAVSELGDPAKVGKYLSDIVKFTINKIPPDKRSKALDSLRKKFYGLNANEIAQKNLPPTSGIGQSITFVKHVLFNHNPHYIREVLNNLVRNL